MPESEAFRECRTVRFGCRKARLGVGARNRGFEESESEALSGCRKARLGVGAGKRAWSGFRKARIGVGAGKRSLAWVPEN